MKTGVKLASSTRYRDCRTRLDAVLARRNAQLLAGMGFHRGVHRRDDRPEHLSGPDGPGGTAAAHARRPDSRKAEPFRRSSSSARF